jgi:hypothetical protein
MLVAHTTWHRDRPRSSGGAAMRADRRSAPGSHRLWKCTRPASAEGRWCASGILAVPVRSQTSCGGESQPPQGNCLWEYCHHAQAHVLTRRRDGGDPAQGSGAHEETAEPHRPRSDRRVRGQGGTAARRRCPGLRVRGSDTGGRAVSRAEAGARPGRRGRKADPLAVRREERRQRSFRTWGGTGTGCSRCRGYKRTPLRPRTT